MCDLPSIQAYSLQQIFFFFFVIAEGWKKPKYSSVGRG